MTKQRILSDRDLGRGMVTVQREGFACALLPTVSYGSRKAAAAAETFDIWIGRVCEVVLSEGCSRQLRERHDKDIYFATPGEIARRQSDATETSKGGKWRMSRASSLLLQRPEQTGVPLSQMLMHFCQSDLAARLAKPEVYARDWYVKRIPGVKQPEPLLTVPEYDPEPEPEPQPQPQPQPLSQPQPELVQSTQPELVHPAQPQGSGRSRRAARGGRGGKGASDSANGESSASRTGAMPPIVGPAEEPDGLSDAPPPRRPSPPAGPAPAAAEEARMYGAMSLANHVELMRETNQMIYRSAAEAEAKAAAAQEALERERRMRQESSDGKADAGKQVQSSAELASREAEIHRMRCVHSTSILSVCLHAAA